MYLIFKSIIKAIKSCEKSNLKIDKDEENVQKKSLVIEEIKHLKNTTNLIFLYCAFPSFCITIFAI